MNNRILIVTCANLVDHSNIFKANKNIIQNRVLILNDTETAALTTHGNLFFDQYTFNSTPAICIGFMDGNPVSQIKARLTADHEKFMKNWKSYDQYLIDLEKK